MRRQMADGESSASGPLDPQELVHATFQALFPDGYHSLLPVRKHRVRARPGRMGRLCATECSSGGLLSSLPCTAVSLGHHALLKPGVLKHHPLPGCMCTLCKEASRAYLSSDKCAKLPRCQCARWGDRQLHARADLVSPQGWVYVLGLMRPGPWVPGTQWGGPA